MANILVIAEHDDGQLKLATLSAVAFAHKVIAETGGAFDVLVIAKSAAQPNNSATTARQMLVADHAQPGACSPTNTPKWLLTLRSNAARRWWLALPQLSKDVLPAQRHC
jgi:electron transfer flavoprotein alpha subunit